MVYINRLFEIFCIKRTLFKVFVAKSKESEQTCERENVDPATVLTNMKQYGGIIIYNTQIY